MPYPAWWGRRHHYDIDGTVGGYGTQGTNDYAEGMETVLSAAQLATMNGETPSVDGTVVSLVRNSNTSIYWPFYFIFPEKVDLTHFILRLSPLTNVVFESLQGSTDTTNGTDGTWTNITQGTGTRTTSSTGDWWRLLAPLALTGSNTGLKGLRFRIALSANTTVSFYNMHIYGKKSSGETPHDIIFLQADGVTEWSVDKDFADLAAGSEAVVQQMYIKNVSSTLTANSITVSVAGSDSGRLTVSLDNVSYATSQSVTSLAPGASQAVYVKFTPPAPASGVYRPYAAYVQSSVGSWS